MPRFAYPKEILPIAALYHAVWHETHSQFMPVEECSRRTMAFFTRRISDLLPTTVVEERNRSIVGFSAWRGHFLSQLFVARAFRGTGVASTLIGAAERGMRARGITEAELHCLVGNDRAKRFYESKGWHNKGEILEPVLGEIGEVHIAFWRLMKTIK